MIVQVSDSSSLGAVLLTLLLDEAGLEVSLSLTDGFLSSHIPAEVGAVVVNNGYHVFELPRSAGLVEALERFTGHKASVHKKKAWFFILGCLVDSRQKLNEWPDRLKDGIMSHACSSGPEKFSVALEKYLAAFGPRFADEWEDCRHLFLPWFLPADFVEPDEDEGADYRYRVRNGATEGQVAVFSDGSMGSLRLMLFNALEARGLLQDPFLKRALLEEAAREADYRHDQLREGDRIFILVALRLEVPLPSEFDLFDEILFTDSRFPELNRAWFSRGDSKIFVVCELYSSLGHGLDLGDQITLTGVLTSALGLGIGSLVFVGQKATRVINVQKLKTLKLWERNYTVSFNGLSVSVEALSLGTANMNKVWTKVLSAKEAITEVTSP